MRFTGDIAGQTDAITALFEASFAASEGPEEGALVSVLARRLIETTEPDDLFGFVALDRDTLAGCILFSRLRFEGGARNVFLLAPVAVEVSRQGRGIGQGLLHHGLSEIAQRGVEVALTYGNPAYYAKVGFHPISQAEIPPPQPLSHPEGWLGQSLTSHPLEPMKGPSHCAPALNDPVYW